MKFSEMEVIFLPLPPFFRISNQFLFEVSLLSSVNQTMRVLLFWLQKPFIFLEDLLENPRFSVYFPFHCLKFDSERSIQREIRKLDLLYFCWDKSIFSIYFVQLMSSMSPLTVKNTTVLKIQIYHVTWYYLFQTYLFRNV